MKKPKFWKGLILHSESNLTRQITQAMIVDIYKKSFNTGGEFSGCYIEENDVVDDSDEIWYCVNLSGTIINVNEDDIGWEEER